ncbi:HTTM domain-containing protein [Chryseolinea sp. T2]|uniref:HTTM domain-containing protein n=1 Tax=Chryseolinea sp. T2 TaxID=3129255 RepID=UPI003077659D
MNKSSQSAGFTIFAFTWALAGLFHQLSFDNWRWHDPKGIILSLAILPVLLKPSSWQRFLVYLLIDWISVGIAFPEHPNHIVFSWVLNACILTSFVIVAIRNKGDFNSDFASQWFAAFVPWARVMVCILYWFTFFHKVNVSFLNPECSCGARLHLDITERIPFLPTALWAQYLAMYGTLIIELAIPFVLLINRTRLLAILGGLLFHGILALHGHIGIFSFSATIFALYTTFFSSALAADLKPPEWMTKIWRLILALFLLGVLLWTLRGLVPALRLDDALRHITKLGFLGFYMYLLLCLVLFGQSALKFRKSEQAMEGQLSAYPVLAIFPIIASVNGLGPYFGLRTESSYSMFSNLHTEGGVSNHLLMPSNMQITNWQKDLVEIVDTNDPDLLTARDHGDLVVYLELRRIRSREVPDFWVIFRRNGKEETYYESRPETHDILPKMNLLAGRYFYFRPVGQNPLKERCKH